MPMYGYGYYGMGVLGMIFTMIIPLAIFGLVVYWAVNLGVKNALKTGLGGELKNIKFRNTGNDINAEEYKR